MPSYGGQAPVVNAVLGVETALAGIVVAMRVYTRAHILRSFGWDDFLLVLTWLLLAVYSAFIAVASYYGLGQRRAELDPLDYIQAQKWETIGQAVCIFNIIFAKCAVAFFLLRIVVNKWHKVLIWGVIISITGLTTFGTVAIFAQCTPVEKVWNIMLEGECTLDFAKIGLAVSAYAVAMDFLLALAPCFIIWDLQMKRKDKYLTISALSLGVFAGVCGILRTTALTSLRSYEEYIYDTCDMLIYSGTENFVSVLCASIPVLRPLWAKVRNGYYGSHSHGSASNSKYELGNYPRSGLSSKSKDRLKFRPDESILQQTTIHGTVYAPGGSSRENSQEEILKGMDGGEKGIHVQYRTEISVQDRESV